MGASGFIWGNTIIDLPADAFGTASADKVLKGSTFTSSAGVKVNGSMESRGALNWNPSSKTSKTIAAGYYSGGTISTENAYNSGYSSGEAAGKSSVSFTGENVDVSDKSVTVGISNGKSKKVDASGIYNKGNSDGYSKGSSDGYSSGYSAGESAGKSAVDFNNPTVDVNNRNVTAYINNGKSQTINAMEIFKDGYYDVNRRKGCLTVGGASWNYNGQIYNPSSTVDLGYLESESTVKITGVSLHHCSQFTKLKIAIESHSGDGNGRIEADGTQRSYFHTTPWFEYNSGNNGEDKIYENISNVEYNCDYNFSSQQNHPYAGMRIRAEIEGSGSASIWYEVVRNPNANPDRY